MMMFVTEVSRLNVSVFIVSNWTMFDDVQIYLAKIKNIHLSYQNLKGCISLYP